MKTVNRIIFVLLYIICLAIGINRNWANQIFYHIISIILFCDIFIFLILKIYKRDFKINVLLPVIFIFLVLGMVYREEKNILAEFTFLFILISYYSLCYMEEKDEKFIKYICLLTTIATILTLFFNGIFNRNIIGGISFSGRLNPFMYLPYMLLTLYFFRNNRIIKAFTYITIALTFVDLFWSESRIAIFSALFILVSYFMLKKKDLDITKKMLRILLGAVIILQIMIPQIYIMIYKNYNTQFDDITYKYTGKSFFSGRQRVWTKIIDTVENDYIYGTGDINYIKQIQAPHNEFLNVYYCRGIIVAGVLSFYLYLIGNKAIKEYDSKIELLIILSFISNIICTTFETYLYAVHFFIFNNFLMSYILNLKRRKNG